MANEPVNTNENNESVKTETKDNTAELEARIKALETENTKLRTANTNASADASAWKKKFQETLSEADKAKAEQDENTAAMKARLEQLESERNIANFTAALTANDIGMDIDTAKGVAEALNAGETNKVFDGIRKFIETHDKALREVALKNNQTLPGGGNSEKIATKEEFQNMSYREMAQFKTDHPEQFAEYTQ